MKVLIELTKSKRFALERGDGGDGNTDMLQRRAIATFRGTRGLALFTSLPPAARHFSKGTSSKSTKLIHGGVRYLAQGNVTLVLDALKERGLLLRNAPGIVKPQPFIIPSYTPWETAYYGIGLKIYDLLAWSFRIRASRFLAAKDVLKAIPTLRAEGLRGGVLYFDASSLLDPASMSAYESMDVKVTGDNLELPLNSGPGTELADGGVTATISSGGVKILTLSVNLTNRKIQARETVETPAGSFECIKYTYDARTEMGFVKMDISGIEWYNRKHGTIRSESYDKKGKLSGYTVLESISN